MRSFCKPGTCNKGNEITTVAPHDFMRNLKCICSMLVETLGSRRVGSARGNTSITYDAYFMVDPELAGTCG